MLFILCSTMRGRDAERERLNPLARFEQLITLSMEMESIDHRKWANDTQECYQLAKE